MISKEPKNTSRYYWTEHAKFKMRFYGLSEQKIIGVVSKPKRKEDGIVEKTIAVMKPVSPKIVNGKEVWKQEVWVMYQKKTSRQQANKIFKNNQLKIISAWRYPGVSPQKNPIPQDILRELLESS